MSEQKKYEKNYPYPLGIDLGTSNSCAAIRVGKEIKIIEAKEGVSKQGKTLASCVSFTESEILVGDVAKNRMAVAAEETVYQAKRHMGTKHEWNIRGTTYRAEQISAYILTKLKTDAEAQLEANITEAVITVPAQFNDTQRVATQSAAKIAGLNCIRLINEPTAAALAYDFEQEQGEQKILVADLGGGTFDVSILKCDNSVFEVIATGGNTKLGGKDIDDIMIKFVAEEITKKYNIIIKDTDYELKEKIRTAAEEAKIALSNMLNTELIIPFLCLDSANKPITVNIPYSRALLEQQIKPITTEIAKSIEQTLAEAKLTRYQIDKLLLVGGPMNMPGLRKVIADTVGKEPSTKLNPNNCVAIGAAKQAAMLAEPEGDKNILLLDVTPLSLGIEVEGGLFSKVVTKNSHIPTKSVQKYTTAEDNQKSVEIRILQGERTMASDNKLLHTFRLENLPAMKRGMPVIEVTFEINSSGILEVTAEESTTKVRQKVTVVNNKNLSEDQIARMVADAEKYKQEDEKRKTKLELIHRAKTSITTIEEYETNDKLQLTDAEKEQLKKYKTQIEQVLTSEDSEKIQSVVKDVESKLLTLLQEKSKHANADTEPAGAQHTEPTAQVNPEPNN